MLRGQLQRERHILVALDHDEGHHATARTGDAKCGQMPRTVPRFRPSWYQPCPSSVQGWLQSRQVPDLGPSGIFDFGMGRNLSYCQGVGRCAEECTVGAVLYLIQFNCVGEQAITHRFPVLHVDAEAAL